MIKPSVVRPLPFRASSPITVSSFRPPGHDWFSGYPSKHQTQFFGEWSLDTFSDRDSLSSQCQPPSLSFYPIFSSNIRLCALHSFWKSSPAHYHPSLFSSPASFLILTLLLFQVLLNMYLLPSSSTRILASGGQGSVLFPWKHFQEC